MSRTPSGGADSVLSWASAQDPAELLPPDMLNDPLVLAAISEGGSSASRSSSSASGHQHQHELPTAAHRSSQRFGANATTPTPSSMGYSAQSQPQSQSRSSGVSPSSRRGSTDRLSMITSTTGTTVMGTATPSVMPSSQQQHGSRPLSRTADPKRNSVASVSTLLSSPTVSSSSTTRRERERERSANSERALSRRDILAHTFAPPAPLGYTPTRAEQDEAAERLALALEQEQEREREQRRYPSRLPVYRTQQTAASALYEDWEFGKGVVPRGKSSATTAANATAAPAAGSDDGHMAASETSSQSAPAQGAPGTVKKGAAGLKSAIMRSFGHPTTSSRDYQAEAADVAGPSSGTEETTSPSIERTPISAHFAYESPARRSSRDLLSKPTSSEESHSPDALSPASSSHQVNFVHKAKGASASTSALPDQHQSSPAQRLQRTTKPLYSTSSFIPSRSQTSISRIPSNAASSSPTSASHWRSASFAAPPTSTARRDFSGPPGLAAPAQFKSSTAASQQAAISFNKDKDLPPRPKSALAGIFGRRPTLRTTPLDSSRSSPSASPSASTTQLSGSKSEGNSKAPSRPGSALGGRLRSLTGLGGGSSSLKPMTPIVNGSSRLSTAAGKSTTTAAPGRATPASTKTLLPGANAPESRRAPATRSYSEAVPRRESAPAAAVEPSRRLSRNLSLFTGSRTSVGEQSNHPSEPSSPGVSSPTSPRSFLRAAATLARGTSISRPITTDDLPNESAIDDDASEAGHSISHAAHRLSGTSSTAPSRRNSLRISRGVSFSRGVYGMLDFGGHKASRSTSPVQSPVELAVTPEDSDEPHSFVRTGVQRVPRSREGSFYPVLATRPALGPRTSKIAAEALPALALPAASVDAPQSDSSVTPTEFAYLLNSAFFGDGPFEPSSPKESPALVQPLPPKLTINTRVAPVEGPKTDDGVLESIAQARPLAERRKTSQPSLSMADDMEFLKALEEVRTLHRERLAKLGTAELSRSPLDGADVALVTSPTDGRSRANSIERSVASPTTTVVAKRPRQRRSSASGDLGGSFSAQIKGSLTQAALDSQKEIDTDALFDAPLSVGRTAGELHNGAFVNDDNWKKEVKALFGEDQRAADHFSLCVD